MSLTNTLLPGVPAYAPPAVYSSIVFEAGQSGGALVQYVPIILANITSQGSAYATFAAGQVFGPNLSPNSQTLQTVSDAQNLFGPGSSAALMYSAMRSANPSIPIFVAPVTAATGTQSSQTITIGGAAAVSGVIQYQVDGKVPAQAVFSSTSTSAQIATFLAAAINGNINLPVTAAASGAVVTVTAKIAGLRGNNLRGFASLSSSGTGVTITGAVNSPANFTSGAGSDAAGYTATMNGIALTGNFFYYFVTEAGSDSLDGYQNGIPAEVQAFIDAQAQAIPGLRQRAVFGSVDTVANTAASQTTLNDPRCECIQMYHLDTTPGELAAKWVGALMIKETQPLTAQSVNFDSFGATANSQGLWNQSAPLDGSAPSASDIQTAIINGVTPLQVTPGRKTKIVKRVTSKWYSLGGSGGNQEVLDLRITDAGVVTLCDYLVNDVSNALSQTFQGLGVIGQDPTSGAPPAPPGVVTPDKVIDVILPIIQQYGAAGLVNSVAMADALTVQQNNPPYDTSIGIQLSIFANSLAHSFFVSALQVSPVVL